MNHRESDWYLAIKDRPVGTRLRMPHDGCSIGDTLMVTKSDKGVNAWCFLCKQPGMFVAPPPESLAAKLARQSSEKAADKSMQTCRDLPLPKEENPSEWPDKARIWLYKAGLNNADIMASGIYYHPLSGRVVIPVCDGETLVYWQARGFEAGKPKYLNPPIFDRTKLVANWHGREECVVLTEDWLSGYRVHRATGVNVHALLGTYATDYITASLVTKKATVVVWLDSDKPGQSAATEIVKKLTAYGLKVVNVVTPKDPKFYSNREIREVLSESGFGVSTEHTAPP